MTNEEMIEHGKRLFQSADNLRQSALDLDALMDSIWSILSVEVFAGGEIRDAHKEDDCFGNDWITPTYTGNCEVRGVGKGSPRLGTITYVARLCGNGVVTAQHPNWPWLDQACLFVGWHNRNDYWGPEDFEPSEEANLHYRGQGLWAYQDHGDDEDYGYFFVIPIFALMTENDIQKYIVKPLKIIFKDNDPKLRAGAAFRDVPVLVPSSHDR